LNNAFQEFLSSGDKNAACEKFGVSKKQIDGKIYRSSVPEARATEPTSERHDAQAFIRPASSQVDFFLDSMPKSKSELVESMFPESTNATYDPAKLFSQGASLDFLNDAAGSPKLPKGFFSKEKKSKPEQSPEEKEENENERLGFVQRIRLYLIAFPDLENLPVVKPDKDKYLLALYSRKQSELEKELNFFQFHVRNSVSENSGHAVVLKTFETAIRTLEVVMTYVGLRAQGLIDTIMTDQDVERCIKEICIEHSISTFSYGPKVDLLFKLGSAVIKQETINRSLDYAQMVQNSHIEKAMKERAKKQAEVHPSNPAVPVSSFADL